MSNLQVLFKDKTPTEFREATDKVISLMKENKITQKDIGLLDIAQATLGDEGMSSMRRANSDECFVAMRENIDPVNLTAFTNITGQLVFQGAMEGYRSPDYIGDSLVTAESSKEDNTRIPGLDAISDDAMEVKEGEEYPVVKFGEDYIDIPSSKKRGMRIGLTREAVFFDRTGQIVNHARSIGERLALNKEKRILEVVLGIVDNYKRKGVAADTYNTTGARINEIANLTLTDWTSLDQMMMLFGDMTDDREVPEPIMVMPKTIIVPMALTSTAARLLSATEVRTTGGAIETIGSNPMRNSLNVVTSPLIQWLLVKNGITLANAKKYWWVGDFKRAFVYRTLFPFQVRAAQHDKDEFERDVVAQFRTDERGVAYVRAPWYAARTAHA